jgi:AraC-like DNA-binding protein
LLAFNLGDPTFMSYPVSGAVRPEPGAALIGQSTALGDRWHGRRIVRFQVLFEPGALFRLTGVRGLELADAFVDAETVFAAEVHRVRERLGSASHQGEMAAVMDAFLLQLAVRPPQRALPLDRIARRMADGDCTRSLDELARAACFSPRQFYNRFVERIGVGPNTFRRIARMNRVILQKLRDPDSSWLDLAPRLGYYDYQHLVKDFAQFTQRTPAQIVDFERDAKSRTVGFPGWNALIRNDH